MEISLKKIETVPEFENIRSLYLSAFPPKERREFNQLIKLLHVEDCDVNLIISGDEILGFCIVWNFIDFVYIEHFAIEPDMRGLGIGEVTLALIKENFDKPVILETELPVDEISSRRIKFYQRNGFRLLHRNYLQPSYGEKKPEVEMKLMSTGVDFSSEDLDRYIHCIRKKVYKLK